jgi:putative transcriptional regulator
MTLQWRLKELIARKERLENTRITYLDIVAATGISTNTLSRMANNKMEQVGLSTIDRLCAYFECEPGDLLVRVEK